MSAILRRVRRINPIRLIGLLAYLFVALGPFFLLLAEVIWNIPADKDSVLAGLLPMGRRKALFFNSIELAVFVTVTSCTAGFLAAGALLRTKKIRAWGLHWSALLALLPPYIHALAWMNLLFVINKILSFLGQAQIMFTGFAASWLVQTMAFLPITVALSITGLKIVDRNLIEAATIDRNDMDVLFRIILPLSQPLLIAAGGIVFVLSITDYSIPSLFQFNVYALEIYAEYSASGNYLSAMHVATPLIIVAFIILVFSQAGIKSSALGCIYDNKESFGMFILPKWYKGLQLLSGCLLLIQFFVPVIMLLMQLKIWGNLVQAYYSSVSEIKLSYVISLLSAIVCLFPAYCAAAELLENVRTARMWWILVLLPVALPAPLVGIALINMWNVPAFNSVSNSIFMPVMGSAARFMPFAALLILGQMRRVDPLLLNAAAVLQKSPLHTWLRVRLPLLTPGFLAASCIVFVLSCAELGATLLLAPPGQETLTIKIYNYMHYGASEKVSGLCLIVLITVVTVGTLAIAAIRKGRVWFV